MTHDAAITTDMTGFLSDMRDKIGGMTGWSIAYDTLSAPVQNGEMWVLKTPTDEYIQLEYDGGGGAGSYKFRFGTAFDTGTESFTSQYDYPSGPKLSPNSNKEATPDYTVTYWLSYEADTGFAWYVHGDEGNNDSDNFVGFAELNKAWDYTAANAEESEYVYCLVDQSNNVTEREWLGYTAGSGETQRARGMTNPDGSVNNFPAHITANICSSQYRNNDTGNDCFIGTHTLWIRDLSGSSTAHLDTLDDGAGNTYKILKKHDNGGEAHMRVL
jgi:hypothetical protein